MTTTARTAGTRTAARTPRRAKSKRADAGTAITLAALMRLYGMKPKPAVGGTWEARHPTARRQGAVVHANAELTRWWIEHPFVDHRREGDLYSFIGWMEGCGLFGIMHMLRDEYPRLLAEAGIPENYGLDMADSKEV